MKALKRSPLGNRGFTLIEMVVVMLLIAIASTLVLMNVGKSGRMKEHRIFVEKLMQLCKSARTTALIDGIPVCMTILPERRVCLILPMGRGGIDGLSTGDPWDEGSDVEAERSEMVGTSMGSRSLVIPSEVRIEGDAIKSDDEGGHHICFYADGSSTGGILTITVEDQLEMTFQVDRLTGALRLMETPEG